MGDEVEVQKVMNARNALKIVEQWVIMQQRRGDDTILRDLKDLMKKDLLRKKGKTKGAQYILKSVIK